MAEDVEATIAAAFQPETGQVTSAAPWNVPAPDQLQLPPGYPPGFQVPNYGLPLPGQDPNAAAAFQIPGYQQCSRCGLHVPADKIMIGGPGCAYCTRATAPLPADLRADLKAGFAATVDGPADARIQAAVSAAADMLTKPAEELQAYKRLNAQYLRGLADLLDGLEEEDTPEVASDGCCDDPGSQAYADFKGVLTRRPQPPTETMEQLLRSPAPQEQF